MTIPVLKPFQKVSVAWLKKRRVAILGHDPGLGKTAICVCVATGVTIVTCPRFLIGVWEEEIQKFRPGSVTRVVEDQEAFNMAHAEAADFILMSYHRFATLSFKYRLGDLMILDEAQAFKSAESKRTKAAMEILRHVPRLIAVTGTPVMNRPIELYPLLSSMGVTRASYYSFGFKYCAGRRTKWGLDFNGASNLDELQKKLDSVMIRFTKEQVLPQLPPKVYKIIPLRINRPKIELEFDLKSISGMKPEVAFETMSEAMKIHAELKFEQVLEFIEWRMQTEEKLVVFTHHRNEMTLPLYEALKKYNPLKILGGMKHGEIKNAERLFQTNKKHKIILVSIQAGGVGLTLNAATRAVFAEAAWSPFVISQAADRIHRLTTINQVNIDMLTIQGSIDEYQIRRALEKLDVISQIVRPTSMKKIISEKLVALIEILEDIKDAIDAEEESAAPAKSKAPAKSAPARGKKVVEEDDDDDDDDDDEEDEAPAKKAPARGKAPAKSAPAARGKKAPVEDDEDDEDDEEEEAPKAKSKAPASRGKSKGKGPTFDDVRAKAAELIDEFAEGADIVKEILEEMGYDSTTKKISALQEDEYAEFIERAQKELDA
jgi:SWI/SNF-related matrix-associated actin-dependent regulator 1 of chromatin subfamily A